MIKLHPFFNGIDWDAIEKGLVEPPIVPELGSIDTDTGGVEGFIDSVNSGGFVEDFSYREEDILN